MILNNDMPGSVEPCVSSRARDAENLAQNGRLLTR
jgi:hypothetical protein